MKRKLLHAVLVASMAVALSGCGNTSGINADAEKTQKATETENIGALRYRLFFNFQRVKRAFFRWISYFFRSFSVFVICYHCHRLFLRRVRYTIPSGGMWPMDRPCPYAAGTVCIYTDHRKPKTIIPE